MNKIMIIASVIISILLFNFGISFKARATALSAQTRGMAHDVDVLTRELKQKQQFVKRPPVGINKAFNLFVNLMRMLEDYGGTKMELLFIAKADKDNLEGYLTGSPFRNVKALPIILKINKCSKATDLAPVLNDIYVLEKQTDFKINAITNDNDVLEVKGDLYGI